MTFKDALTRRSEQVGRVLDTALADFASSNVADGMRYAVSGGKRLRGFLVMEGAALHDVSDEDSRFAAAAIEALHAYSLVHDDLPCMDDDDLRRGQPTVHVKWDEATAVLVGDALQSLAFDLIAKGGLRAEVKLGLSEQLASLAGGRGMVRGQALDIAAETAQVAMNLEEIIELQALKTGALIKWSALAGPSMAGADTKPMERYADALGLAFQIADDILDVEGDETTAGKRLQKDEKAGKATFVSQLGLDGAKARARELVAEALDALSLYSAQADYLREAARFVVSRDK
ncbi:MAG: polyprenyl synthetase family protein [Pseudomonadota bacterium]